MDFLGYLPPSKLARELHDQPHLNFKMEKVNATGALPSGCWLLL